MLINEYCKNQYKRKKWRKEKKTLLTFSGACDIRLFLYTDFILLEVILIVYFNYYESDMRAS